MTISNDNSGLVVAALELTDAELATSVDALSTWRMELQEQGARVTLYRQYEEGEHRSGITTQMRNMLRLPVDDTGIDDFNDNYCRIIVDKMASRLQVSEITTGDEGIDKGWLVPLLERNDWQAVQGTLYQGAVRDGDSYIMVDPNTLQWSSEAAFDGFSGIVCITDATGKIPIWACKLWSESESGGAEGDEQSTVLIKVVVYQPNMITYWQGRSGGRELVPDNQIVGAEPVTTGSQGTNLLAWPVGRIPVIHFANQPTNFSTWGKSELRPAIPLQDVLNRTLHSMVMASEFAAFRIKWSIGMEIDAAGITPGAVINLTLKDSSGNIVTDMSENEINFLQAVKVGQFEETDINQYITQIDKLAREISQISQTPIYGVTTEGVLSGEALRQLEVGLLGKCYRFQRDNTDAIRQLITVTALIQNSIARAETGLPPAPSSFKSIAPVWQSPELLDANAQVALLIQMRKDAPGLWDDDFYRAKIGALLKMRQADIEAEGLKADQAQSNTLDKLIGAGSGIPVVA